MLRNEPMHWVKEERSLPPRDQKTITATYVAYPSAQLDHVATLSIKGEKEAGIKEVIVTGQIKLIPDVRNVVSN